MYPSECIGKFWNRISVQVKITFISSIIIGLFVHLFTITNFLPNHDSYLFGDRHIAGDMGRWFTFVPRLLTDSYLLPWLGGSLAIVFIAISSCVVINCLRINNKLHCVLVSGLMVSFPTVTTNMLYIAGPHFNMLSLLLACLAVYVSQRYRYGFCFGSFFIAFSLGIYQAFFPVAAGLLVAVLIVDIIQTELSFKDIVIKGTKFLITLLLGVIVYFIITKLVLSITGDELRDYQGVNEMGKIPVLMLPGLIKKTYATVIDFFYQDYYGIHILSKITVPVIIIISVFLLVMLIIQKRLIMKGTLFPLVLLIVLFPIAANIVYIMAPKIDGLGLTVSYGMVLFLIAVIVLMEMTEEDVKQKETRFLNIFRQGACWILTIIILLCNYNYALMANKAYTKAHIVYEHGYSKSVELITRMESADGYKEDIPILFTGGYFVYPGLPMDQYPMFGELGRITGSINSWTTNWIDYYIRFLQEYCGFNHNIVWTGLYDQIERFGLGEVRKMPTYPSPGSIKTINGILVVNFAPPQQWAKDNIIPNSGLPLPNSGEMIIRLSYDVFDFSIIEDSKILLESGNADPKLYISCSAIEKPSEAPFIEIMYTNTVPGDLQIFYNYGQGLSNENSTGLVFLDEQLEEKTIKLPISPWLEGERLVGFLLNLPKGSEFTIVNLKFPFLE